MTITNAPIAFRQLNRGQAMTKRTPVTPQRSEDTPALEKLCRESLQAFFNQGGRSEECFLTGFEAGFRAAVGLTAVKRCFISESDAKNLLDLPSSLSPAGRIQILEELMKPLPVDQAELAGMPLYEWACGKDHGTYLTPAGMKVICPCGVEARAVKR